MKMPLIYILLSGLIILILSIYLYKVYKSYQQKESSSTPNITYNLVVADKHKFQVEIADNEYKLQKGLMNRSHMDEDKGMLFVFGSSGLYPFWMKNTLIPLDMIWINDKYQIVYIYKNAQPCSNTLGAICSSIIPPVISRYVLEVNAGVSNTLQIKEGDSVKFNLPKN